MNREILFRGKRIDNSKWINGYFVISDERYFIGVYPECITTLYFLDDYSFTSFIEVDQETVGQYTGIIDALGERIFEGDIIEYVKRGDESNNVVVDRGLVVFSEGKFYIKDSDWNKVEMEDLFCGSFEGWKNGEVVGNIYDNPELLDGKE